MKASVLIGFFWSVFQTIIESFMIYATVFTTQLLILFNTFCDTLIRFNDFSFFDSTLTRNFCKNNRFSCAGDQFFV